ncbi:MAG TPA: outer membrane beta-barrel protein [Flavipsychrobacter sp.]|nr:outer membrane beta-barrel protein [Flavipsychrobacter sp.]
MKQILLLTGFLMIQSGVFAQREVPPDRIFLPDDEKVFYGGVTVGGNISEVIGDAYHGYHKLGWHIGPGVVTKFNQSILGMSLELLYSQKGSRGVKQLYSNAVGDYFERYYLDLNYVEVPVQLLIIPQPRYYVGAGLSYSRLIKSKERMVTMQQLPGIFREEDYPFLKEDWNWLVSAKYQFWRGWFVGARYARSLKPIRRAEQVPYYFGSGHQYNMYFTISVSYLIP